MINIKFSVIIPFYNAEKTIERTLASLISNRDFIEEVILVDDRTTDNTVKKINAFKRFLPIKVIQNTRKQGPGPARKTGLFAAKGEWITFIDADDEVAASSFYYVAKEIETNPTSVLLHCQTMYMETGVFNPEDIRHSDTSCGGNFYQLNYLIQNNLYPDEDLYMSEDEFFNNKIIFYIHNIDKNDELESWYDFPVYIVHHDLDDSSSFSFDHWKDYICRYHIEGVEKMMLHFQNNFEAYAALREYFCKEFIFAFYLFNCTLCQDISLIIIPFEHMEYINYYNSAFAVYEALLNGDKEQILEYYISNTEVVEFLQQGAELSCGASYNDNMPFEKFLNEYIA